MNGIARRIAFDIFAEVDDLARALVPERDGNDPEGIALPFVHVGSAYAAALDFDENVVVVERGNGILFDLDMFGGRERGDLCGFGNPRALLFAAHFAKDLTDDILDLSRRNIHIVLLI